MTYGVHAQQADHSSTLPQIGRVPVWTWRDVEDRLAEAMRLWWRSHDGDARFSLRGRISSVWQQALSEPAFIDIQLAQLQPLPLSRADMARMTEASEWLRHVREEDRRLVVLVLGYLAKGEKKVPWLKVKRRMGVAYGADGLRKRYSRAITAIANVLNMAENRQGSVSSPQTTPPSKKTMSATQPG
jgi:hypothetical protein